MRPLNVIIIGAGLSGLACGIRLAAEGCRVKILEKNSFAGGSLGTFEVNGFQFNTGAEIITAPFLFDQLFECAGKHRIDSIKFLEVDPIFQAIFPSRNRFSFYKNPNETIQLNGLFSDADLIGFKNFSEASSSIFDEVFFDYCGSPVDETTFSLRSNLWFRRLNAQQSCQELADKFFRSPELKQFFGFWPLLGGGNPRQESHLFRLVSQLFQRWGAAVPEGGMENLVNAIVSLFSASGGEILFNTEVSEIQIFNKTVSGVRLKDGGILQADLVISAADTAATYRNLIDIDRNRYNVVESAKQRPAGFSLFVYHIGTRCVLQERQELTPFNILFPENYDQFLDELFEQKVVSANPLMFLRMPSKTEALKTPEGTEALSLIVPVPNLESYDGWRYDSYAYRNRLLNLLQQYFVTDIRSNLIAESFFDPLAFQNRLGCYAGSVFSFQPTLQKSGEIRMANRSKDIRNLYLIGNGAHPGASMVGALLGAANTVELIKSDFADER